MLCINTMWCKHELRARSKNVAQSTQITSPPLVPLFCCPPFFGFRVWKVSRDLRAPERVALFGFEVWSDIRNSMEEAGKLWLIRTEQSQIVQSFDCSEWLCQWQLLKGQISGLIFDLALFVHLNGACRYGWNLIFWLRLTLSHTSSLPAFLCNSSGQRYIPQNSIYIS